MRPAPGISSEIDRQRDVIQRLTARVEYYMQDKKAADAEIERLRNIINILGEIIHEMDSGAKS